MKNHIKLNGVDYLSGIAIKISDMHQLVEENLKNIIKEGDKIIDIGGGPGMGARIIDHYGIKAKVLNIEPCNTVDEIPKLSNIEYIPLKQTFKEALSSNLPWLADIVLMVSAEHEIALSNEKSNIENKKIFFQDLIKFLDKNTKEGGIYCVGFPNYKKGISNDNLIKQRRYSDSKVGHSHSPDEFFTIDEFQDFFSTTPIIHVQKPMILDDEKAEETCLLANFAAFYVKGT